MNLTLSTSSIADYQTFLKVKSLPRYAFTGRTATVPDEYAAMLGGKVETRDSEYTPISNLFDYQRDIAALAIRKQKFAVFAECGLGKDLMMKEFSRHAAQQIRRQQCVLMVTPSMVIKQSMAETKRFYGDSLPIRRVHAHELNDWLKSGDEKIGITNYESLRDDVEPGRIGALILDESSLLKSHYGKWGQTAIRLGRGLNWKLALTGTPAPNDRIEYANHAVFLDRYPTVNAFLARFFVNRGQTDNRWELKPHALHPFYRALSDWCIFLTNPATYGWKDNCGSIPPIKVHIQDVALTGQQRDLTQAATGKLFAGELGGIMSRSTMGQIAKGTHKGTSVETNKPAFIRALVESWPDESTIIWCLYNAEQELMEKTFPDAGSISGDTPEDERERIIEDFKSGKTRVLISKGKVLGFGLNLQIATRQVFSGLQDSYELFHQCVKRSNRIGSSRALNVHIPVTAIERPMIDTVLRKAKRIDEETAEQERIFKDASRI
jgi:superfamily II DNA or RNA helicase